MRRSIFIASILLTAFSAQAQKDKSGLDTLRKKFDYLFHGSSTEGYIYKSDNWSGQRISVQGEFDIYQLPTDQMNCLVPNLNNPSIIPTVKISLPVGPGKIPNPLEQPWKSSYLREKPGQ